MRKSRKRKQGTSGSAGTQRSGVEAEPDVRRGRPGRRSTEERLQAVLELLRGKATVDELALRFGVRGATIEKWKDRALEGVETALRNGGRSPRERELAKELEIMEKAHTRLAKKHELLERALENRPSLPGKSSR